MENDYKEKNLFRQMLDSEATRTVAIVVAVFSIAGSYFSITKDIALIQASISNINTNHEAHIQDIMQELKDQKSEILDLQRQILIISTQKQ